MKYAHAFGTYPNESSDDFGELDEIRALALFDSFPWERHLCDAQELERKGIDSLDADVVFRIGNVHFMARIRPGGKSFEVEVWVVRVKKLLGIFGGAKCYSFDDLGAKETREVLRTFLSGTAQEQHSFYQRLKADYRNRANTASIAGSRPLR